jgi:hypothetical protein
MCRGCHAEAWSWTASVFAAREAERGDQAIGHAGEDDL